MIARFEITPPPARDPQVPPPTAASSSTAGLFSIVRQMAGRRPALCLSMAFAAGALIGWVVKRRD